MVWQDMPSGMAAGRRHQVQPGERDDVSFTPAEDAQFRAELKAMIDHLRVFPSIVVWVPFNEGWGQHATNEILQWVKSYDPTRLVNGPSGWTDRDFGDMKDMHNYPGPGMFPAMPDRVSVLGEFGGLGLPLKGHLWKDSDNWGYQSFRTTEDLRQGYRQLVARMRPLVGRGLSAAVYTQTTDVEVEVNGLMTYDREVVKMDVKQTAAWHKALFGPPPEVRELVPTSVQAARKWRHTTAKPPTGWERPDFDAGAWPEADGGFGTRGTPGAVVRTEWNTRRHLDTPFRSSCRPPPPAKCRSRSITTRTPRCTSTACWPRPAPEAIPPNYQPVRIRRRGAQGTAKPGQERARRSTAARPAAASTSTRA